MDPISTTLTGSGQSFQTPLQQVDRHALSEHTIRLFPMFTKALGIILRSSITFHLNRALHCTLHWDEIRNYLSELTPTLPSLLVDIHVSTSLLSDKKSRSPLSW